MNKKIALMSDLHCHPQDQKQQASYLFCDALEKPINRHPIASLKELIHRENINADVLISTGDITDKTNQQGFISGWKFIKEIKDKLNANKLISTIGNHDVDPQKNHNSNPFHIPKNLDDNFPIDDSLAINSFWSDGFYTWTNDDFFILAINSVHHHHDENQAKRGEIDSSQLDKLEKELDVENSDKIKIAVCHHHPIQHEILDLGSEDLMINGENLVELLIEKKFHLLVHGHKHHPRLKYFQSGGSKFPVFATGSFSACSSFMLSNSRNLFHIIEFNNDKKGIINSWEFKLSKGWQRASYDSCGFPKTTGFGATLSVNQIKEAIYKYFKDKKKDIVEWKEIENEIPEIHFLIPSEFLDLGDSLSTAYNLKTSPKPPYIPDYIGTN